MQSHASRWARNFPFAINKQTNPKPSPLPSSRFSHRLPLLRQSFETLLQFWYKSDSSLVFSAGGRNLDAHRPSPECPNPPTPTDQPTSKKLQLSELIHQHPPLSTWREGITTCANLSGKSRAQVALEQGRPSQRWVFANRAAEVRGPNINDGIVMPGLIIIQANPAMASTNPYCRNPNARQFPTCCNTWNMWVSWLLQDVARAKPICSAVKPTSSLASLFEL